MTVDPSRLAPTAAAFRSGELDPADYLEERYDRIDAVEADVRAWVDGPRPREATAAEARSVADRYPDPDRRPTLYGVPVGIKDVFHVSGLPTRAGSDFPPGVLAGPQAAVVTALREAGGVVLGKTVTTEFAYFDPGPTRNPHDRGHTPGGSSSGSAAAVASGMCPLAVGTQTVGSVIRPAAFCGVVGFKPTYERIPTGGTIPLAPSVDHVGLFTADVEGMAVAADIVLDDDGDGQNEGSPEDPVLGVPDEAYLSQADDAGRERFEDAVAALRDAGFEVRRTDALSGIDGINDRHDRLVAAEAAAVHRDWFDEYGDRYAAETADLIRRGRTVSVGDLIDARAGRERLRERLSARMADRGIDAWIAPAAPGPAPEGIDDTGDPVMNLPWTHAGLPTVGLPAGTVDGLPVGVQVAGRFADDETVLEWASSIAEALAALP